MTTEPTQPQPEMGPAQANGQGQSQGHRRRRRRRKNKSSQQGAPQAQQAQPQHAGARPRRRSRRAAAEGRLRPRQNQGRKKKKFFQKGLRQPPHRAARQQHRLRQQHGRRKERQKGPRTFVGPMDHSYRAVNGNVADGPPPRFRPQATDTAATILTCTRPRPQLRCGKMRPRASSASSTTCSSRPRFRRRRANSA